MVNMFLVIWFPFSPSGVCFMIANGKLAIIVFIYSFSNTHNIVPHYIMPHYLVWTCAILDPILNVWRMNSCGRKSAQK